MSAAFVTVFQDSLETISEQDIDPVWEKIAASKGAQIPEFVL